MPSARRSTGRIGVNVKSVDILSSTNSNHQTMTADNPESILKKKKRRRRILTAFGFVISGGAGYWYATGDIPGEESLPEVSSNTILNTHIDDLEWTGLTLAITFAEDTDADGFTIQHEYQEEIEDAIYMSEMPDFGGVVEVRFDRIIDDWDNYPTHTFKIVLWKGEFSGSSSTITSFGFAEERLSSSSVDVPEEQIPDRTISPD
ncbi:hypothetical protein ACFSUP_04360 [Gracilibacillus thailandensis]|uniref:hypothetical protein n=1 Tax=Gracilibacillus thailandensis TaxID=563735 RepID=UPI0036350BFA